MIKSIYRLLLLLLLLSTGEQRVQAQRVDDSLSVSLLTCSPGQQVYELYGHTALRVENHTLGTDAVFNYGVFDFRRPHFLWYFLLGHTDYMVQPIPYPLFEDEYAKRGSSIEAQYLNLTRPEANELYNRLLTNSRPEHATYRYNFLYRNCTTQVRDVIESVLHSKRLYYAEGLPKYTYRESLHRMTEHAPWARVGDDLLLGATADTLLTEVSMQFLPSQLRDYYAKASIEDNMTGQRVPLVLRSEMLLQERPVPSTLPTFPLTPVECAMLFLALSLLIAAAEYATRYLLWVYDLLLMPAIGVAGVLVTFMFLFSEHPTVGSNWQVWVFNPLPLFCMPWVVWCAIKRRRCYYHYFNALVLLLFLVATPWIPQHYSEVTLLLVLALLTRPMSYLVNFGRQRPPRKKAKKSRRKSASA